MLCLLSLIGLYCTSCVLGTQLLTQLTVFQSAVFWIMQTLVSSALRCNCTTAQCERNGFQCETDGACMASTSFIDGIEQHIRICITRDKLVPPGQPFYCLSAAGLLNIHCCYTDYCNSIDLKVPSGESCRVAHSIRLRWGHQASDLKVLLCWMTPELKWKYIIQLGANT